MLALGGSTDFGVVVDGRATVAGANDDGFAVPLAEGFEDVDAEGAEVGDDLCMLREVWIKVIVDAVLDGGSTLGELAEFKMW